MSKERWAYTMGGRPLPEPVRVDEDFRGAGAERCPVVTDLYMDGTVSPIDGSDIGTRAKRRAHMREHGVVDADDFKGEWAKARAKREEFYRTGNDGKDWGARLQTTLERMTRGGR